MTLKDGEQFGISFFSHKQQGQKVMSVQNSKGTTTSAKGGAGWMLRVQIHDSSALI